MTIKKKNDEKCHNVGVLIHWKNSVYVTEHIFVEEVEKKVLVLLFYFFCKMYTVKSTKCFEKVARSNAKVYKV